MSDMKVGIIGAGSIAQGHIERLLKLPGLRIAGLADPNAQSLQRTQERHGAALANTPQFSDYRRLLEIAQPDAVVICTPHAQHLSQAVDSLDSGAHVLLEKPLVNTVADARTLIRKVSESGKIAGIAYQRHTAPEFRFIKAKIASGDFGDVQFISALQQQSWAQGTIGTWRQDPALAGGGYLHDSGSHLLDIILWTTGIEPVKVAAFIDNRGTPVDINSAVTVLFGNGAQGNLSLVGDGQGWYEDITIWCERGSFFIRNGQRLQVQSREKKLSMIEDAEMPAGTDIDTNFIRAIQGQEEIAASPMDGLRTMQLTEAAWKSGASGGQPVVVDRK